MLPLFMEIPPSESGDIAIRCPGCGQRFKVGLDLRGRMVECGSCDQRFRVDDEVTVRQKKFYPGERRDASLDRFSRVPTKSVVTPTFEPVYYESEVSAEFAEPTSPFRLILGGAGVVGAVMVALVLMFGGGPGGLLDGASIGKRVILALFTAILTLALLLVANPRSRMRAGFIGMAFAAILMAIPFFFREGTEKQAEQEEVVTMAPEEPEVSLGDPLAVLKEAMHYEPVEEALKAYGPDRAAQGKTAFGVWLRDLRDFNKHQVSDYLTKSTMASDASWIYPRPPDDFLMVLIDVDNDLEAIRELCSRFGEVTQVIEELQVVEVKVDNETFVQGPMEKLTDYSSPSFYELNRRELDSIDPRRAEEAVKRLGAAEPKLFRKDIVMRMQELLDADDADLAGNIASALSKWAEDGDGSVEAVREIAEALMANNGTVPRPVILFLVEQGDLEVIPVLDQLWLEEPGTWEALYGELGPGIEDRVLAHFQEGSITRKISAATLLAKAGTSKSLPDLKAAQEDARSELAVVIGRAIE
ncbi:MAG: hypothetical protein AAGB14_08870, partial [Verrucomicrobiota bacterium]